MDYYKRYMGDYQRDTGDLSLAQHGAYALLLDHYYSVRKPLPAAMEKLHRLCRATTKPEQDAVETIANEFFPIGQDGLRHNNRADEEIAKWEAFAEENREKGKLGGRPKKNPTGNPTGNPEGNPAGYHSGKPEETRRDSHGLEKPPVLETREKPSPTPNPNPNPESRILSLTESSSAGSDGQNGGNGSGRVKAGKGGSANGIPPGLTLEQAQQLQCTYPAGTYRQVDWQIVEKYVNQHLAKGVSYERILASFERYRLQIESRGKVGTDYVLSPVKHCDLERPLFDEPFPLSRSKSETTVESNINAGMAFLAGDTPP